MAAVAPARPRRGYLDGLNNEQRLKVVLADLGCTVRRVEHGGDVAYPLRGWHQRQRLPALQCWWNEPGRLTWVAAEWKSTTGVMRVMGNLPTTGIDRARFLQFQAVEQLTGHPVVLVFLQKAQDAVVVTDLRANLLPAVGRGNPMSFYSYGALRRLCRYQELMAVAPPAPAIEDPLFSPPTDGHQQLDLFGKAF
jgi:hypothetical protein